MHGEWLRLPPLPPGRHVEGGCDQNGKAVDRPPRRRYGRVVESTTTPRKRRQATRPPRRRDVHESASDKGPLSVPLPNELRARLARQASARGLKMATAARVLLDERLRDLEDAHELSQAEEWQRAQAWATWEAIQAGDRRDVPMEEFRAVTEQALARLDAKARSR
jgi:hypothetical protein